MKIGRKVIVYRFFCLVFLACLFFSPLFEKKVFATESADEEKFYEYNGLKYLINLDDKTAVAAGSVDLELKKLTIPKVIIFDETEFPVVGIREYAFEGSSLTSAKIGDNVAEIGVGAFAFSENLSKVTIPSGCQVIGDAAFFLCSSLKKISLSKKADVAYVGSGAFAGTGITSFYIPNNVKSIGEASFADCKALTKVTIGSGLEQIGAGAFSGCTGIAAFAKAKGNDNFEIKDNIIYTKECKELISAPVVEGAVEIPDGTEKIADRAFEGNSGVTSLSIPKGVVEIGEGAFMCCDSLNSITLPEGLKIIGDNAFYGCMGLTSVTIPKTVTEVKGNPFKYCSGLSGLKVAKGNKTVKIVGGMLASYDGKTLISAPAVSGIIVLSSKFLYVNDFAFCGNGNVAAIKLNEKLQTVGEGAFYDCVNLRVVQIGSDSTVIYDQDELGDILI